MSRRRRAVKRIVAPDPKFNSTDLVKFTNRLMIGGNKSVVQRMVYQVLDELEKTTKKPGKEVFDQAIRNAMPSVEVKARRVGGATYQVPVEVKPSRRLSLAIRWLVDAARSRSGMPISRKLYQELLDASNGEGVAVKRKEDTHRMAEANRAFAHYRW
jgi:small subunit ribosomal protein S7